MGRLKPDMRNLSQGEADTIVSIVKKVLDVIVDMTPDFVNAPPKLDLVF